MNAETTEKIIQAVQALDSDYDESECYKAIMRYMAGIEVDADGLCNGVRAIFELVKLVIK